MLTNWKKNRCLEGESFDMTPIIDVVFLLIIFFMLVCQFIAAEQFEVQVPDHIRSARTAEPEKNKLVTITVMTGENSKAVYAVGSEKLDAVRGGDLAQLICLEIDRNLSTENSSGETVCLRCDKSVTFGQVKYILSGISKSKATDLDWAVLSE